MMPVAELWQDIAKLEWLALVMEASERTQQSKPEQAAEPQGMKDSCKGGNKWVGEHVHVLSTGTYD